MHFIIALLFLFGLVTSVHANPKAGTAYTQERCFTKVGTKSVKHVPTSTLAYTIEFNFPVIVKSTPTSIVRPAPTTTTTISTLTTTVTSTNSAMTDTFTSFTTPISTFIMTSTKTQTETDTTTTTIMTSITLATVTSTVGTPPGYTPLASQLSSMGVQYAKRRSLPTHNAKAGSLMARGASHLQHGIGGPNCSKSYPQSVECKEVIEKILYITKTISSHKTVTSTATPATFTATSTSTTTSTSTVALPDISTTVTSAAPTTTITAMTQISTTTTTYTTITTSATVQVIPTASVYDACQADNLISQANDASIDNIQYGLQTVTQISTATSPVDCCNQCQEIGCQFFILFNNGDRTCYSISDSESPAVYDIVTDTSVQANPDFVGNGINGQVRTVLTPQIP